MTMSRVAQFRAEHLLKIRGEDFGIDRAVDQKGRRDIFGPQSIAGRFYAISTVLVLGM